jgi:hypothetical protein
LLVPKDLFTKYCALTSQAMESFKVIMINLLPHVKLVHNNNHNLL